MLPGSRLRSSAAGDGAVPRLAPAANWPRALVTEQLCICWHTFFPSIILTQLYSCLSLLLSSPLPPLPPVTWARFAAKLPFTVEPETLLFLALPLFSCVPWKCHGYRGEKFETKSMWEQLRRMEIFCFCAGCPEFEDKLCSFLLRLLKKQWYL